MNRGTILLFFSIFFVQFSFGQLIITGKHPDDLNKEKSGYKIDTTGQLIIRGGRYDDLGKTSLSCLIDTTEIKGDSTFVIVNKFDNDTLIFQEEQIFLPAQIIFHGHSTQWYKNGQKKCEGTFNYGKQNYDWIYWNKYGMPILKGIADGYRSDTITYYIDGIKIEPYPIKNDCISFKDTLNREIYSLVDEMPKYKNGFSSILSFFSQNFIYPQSQKEFQGSIFISYNVEMNGTLSNITTYNFNSKIQTPVDKEAIRVFQLMTGWSVGKCGEGNKVIVRMSTPIKL